MRIGEFAGLLDAGLPTRNRHAIAGYLGKVLRVT